MQVPNMSETKLDYAIRAFQVVFVGYFLAGGAAGGAVNVWLWTGETWSWPWTPIAALLLAALGGWVALDIWNGVGQHTNTVP